MLTGGELTVLMGPSGSGKTTMPALTEGSVFICGHATQGAGPERLASIRRQHIGFAFQSFHLFPTLTAEENVRLALESAASSAAVPRSNRAKSWNA